MSLESFAGAAFNRSGSFWSSGLERWRRADTVPRLGPRERGVERDGARQARREFGKQREFLALGAGGEIQSDVAFLKLARPRLQLRRVGRTPLRPGAARESEQR